jgi:uncharacterized membrane protein
MLIFTTVALIIFYLGFPIVIIYATQKVSFFNRVGAVVLAYIFGLIVSSLGLLPRASNQLKAALEGKSNLSSDKIRELLDQGAITARML